jgi:hypothetical protein
VVPCERGHCQGTMRYCSVSCRKSSACTSLHSERHCRFLGQLLTIKNAQISMANEPFAEYISTATGRPAATYRSGSEQCKLSTSGGSSTSSFRPISGGIRTMCQVGDPVEVVQFPHQMDAGGSLLVRHNQGTKEKLLLVDVEALETWTDPDTHSQNLRLLQASNHLWLRGIAFWINDGAYREAVSCFRESLQIFDWPDNNSVPASTQKLFWEATLQPSLLATEPEQTIVTQRSHFLAMFLNDDSSHGNIDEVLVFCSIEPTDCTDVCPCAAVLFAVALLMSRVCAPKRSYTNVDISYPQFSQSCKTTTYILTKMCLLLEYIVRVDHSLHDISISLEFKEKEQIWSGLASLKKQMLQVT